jgi:hypothetical protein
MGKVPGGFFAWAVLAAALALAFFPVVAGKQTLLPHQPGVMSDGPYLYPGPRPIPAVFDPASSALNDLPVTRLISEYWRRGKPPLWNPYVGCGAPILAKLDSASCSPMRLPLYLYPVPAVWNAFYLGRLLLAGGLTFHLGRALGLAAVPALGAGIAYMLGGYLVLSLNLHHLDVDVVLPGLLLAVDRLIAVPSILALAGCALFFWQMCLGNNPQPLVVGFLFMAALAALRMARLPAKTARRRGILVALGLAAGGAGALFQWLPFMEFLSRAWHAHVPGGARSAAGSLPLSSALDLPGFWAAKWCDPPAFYYAGLLVCLLACAGAARLIGMRGAPSRAGRDAVALLAVVVALELAKIFGAPGLGALAFLPVIGNVWLVKYAAPLFLSLALLAGFGIAAAASRLAPRSPSLQAVIQTALVLLVWGELALLRPGPHPGTHDPLRPAPYINWLIAKQARDPDARVCGIGNVLMPNMATAFHLRDVRIEASLIDREQRRLLFDGLSAPKPAKLATFVTVDRIDSARVRLLRRLGVRYLIAEKGWSPPADLAGCFTTDYDEEVRIFRLSGAGKFPGFAPRGARWFSIGLWASLVLGPGFLAAGMVMLGRGKGTRPKTS